MHRLARQTHRKAPADLSVDGLGNMRREMIGEDFLDLAGRALQHIERALLGPFVRAAPITDTRIEIFGLHQLQGLVTAEKMAGTVEAYVFDGLERQTLLVHFDALDGALCGTNDVIVDNQALERKAQQAGMHAGRFINHVGAGVTHQGMVEPFLGARLPVGNF